MKKEILTIVISLVLIMAICLVAGGIFIRPYKVPLASDTVTVRLPGEYEKNAIVRYNSQYVSQERDEYLLTITLEKPGYYYVSVLGNDYILEWVDDEKYDIDLLNLEKKQVNLIGFKRGAAYGLGVSIFVAAITYGIGYSIHFKKKRNKCKEQEKIREQEKIAMRNNKIINQ